MLRLSYAQLNVRLYVEDREGVPSVFFRHMLVPPWVVPVARLVGRQPASPGRFRYPRPSRSPDAGEWRWRVSGGSSTTGLEVRVRQGSPAVGAGPPLGSWDQTVHYFRDRMRGYAEVDGRLHKIDTEQPRVAVWPVAAEVVDGSLLEASLPLAGGAAWPPLHSAWLCPEIPFTYELSVAPQLEISPRLPQAAASSRSRV
jgi:hypothetical protein